MAGVTFGPDAWAGSGETFDIITPSGHGEDYRLVARWKGPAVGCFGFVAVDFRPVGCDAAVGFAITAVISRKCFRFYRALHNINIVSCAHRVEVLLHGVFLLCSF